jgi:hypothetical protein
MSRSAASGSGGKRARRIIPLSRPEKHFNQIIVISSSTKIINRIHISGCRRNIDDYWESAMHVIHQIFL